MTPDPVSTRFIVFSAARSGTSFLTATLRSHPQVLCHGEALLPRHVKRHVQGSAGQELTPDLCEADPLAFVERLYEINDGFPIVGFKIFPAHSREAHMPLLRDESIHKIVLRRENALASFSSLLVARQTGLWNASEKTKDSKAGTATVTFDAAEFTKYRTRLDKYFAKVEKQAQGPKINLTYEADIMGNRMTPVFDFLDADSTIATSSDKAKLLGRSIIDRFDNRDEVSAHLKEIGHPEWEYE